MQLNLNQSAKNANGIPYVFNAIMEYINTKINEHLRTTERLKIGMFAYNVKQKKVINQIKASSISIIQREIACSANGIYAICTTKRSIDIPNYCIIIKRHVPGDKGIS